MIVYNGKNLKDFVTSASELNLSLLDWKPLYPNNMPGNGKEGEYCVLLHKTEDGWRARKYTIQYQYEEIQNGLTDRNKIELYILFEKTYTEIKGELSHPEPEDSCGSLFDNENTFSKFEVNSYGSFVRAFKNIEDAKARALFQYKAIYGYAMSHIV